METSFHLLHDQSKVYTGEIHQNKWSDHGGRRYRNKLTSHTKLQLFVAGSEILAHKYLFVELHYALFAL